MAALPHDRPLTLTNRRTQMIGHLLAYCLNQTRQCEGDYRPGMTPEEVHAVYLRGEQKKGRSAPWLSPHASGCTRSSMVRLHLYSVPKVQNSNGRDPCVRSAYSPLPPPWSLQRHLAFGPLQSPTLRRWRWQMPASIRCSWCRVQRIYPPSISPIIPLSSNWSKQCSGRLRIAPDKMTLRYVLADDRSVIERIERPGTAGDLWSLLLKLMRLSQNRPRSRVVLAAAIAVLVCISFVTAQKAQESGIAHVPVSSVPIAD